MAGFQYQRRTADAVEQRANQRGGMYDNYIKDRFKIFNPSEGDHQIRIMPPTWKDAEHFGLDIYVHYGIGADNQTYLCLDQKTPNTCPICAERRAIEREDPEYAKKLAPTKRVLLWIIDRDKEQDGPLVWPMSWTVDRDIAALCVDKRSKEVLYIDDPANGYDVAFRRQGTGMTTKYIGLQVARRSSPLGDSERQEEEWLASIMEFPLNTVLEFYEADHIREVFAGGGKKEEDKKDDQPRTRGGDRERITTAREEAPPTRERIRTESVPPPAERPGTDFREVRRQEETAAAPTNRRVRIDPPRETERAPQEPPQRVEAPRGQVEQPAANSSRSRRSALFDNLDDA